MTIYLGNLDAKRDWGFAGDFVEAAFAEVELLLGDPFKAKEKLGREAYLKDGGYEVKRYHE